MARIDKINEEVKRELANIIRELKDTRIPLMTSVVTVNVTNDLRYARHIFPYLVMKRLHRTHWQA